MVKGQKRGELILYSALWAVLFMAPVLSMYVDAVADHSSTYDWEGVYRGWGLLSMFFATFCIHNFIIAPLLVYRNRRVAYAVLTVVLAAGFMLYQTHCRPDRKQPPRPAASAAAAPYYTPTDRPPLPPDGDMRHGPGNGPSHGPGHRHGPRRHRPPMAFGGKDSVAFIIMALLLGLNVGVKYYFKSLDDRKRLHDLERENLNTQLKYLKYQINPHFFMNTLNNIHALVLIDPEQANEMIETLSKLMRYVLYDGNNALTPLAKELAFTGHYISLMKVRYTAKVAIRVAFPDPVPDIKVPPMLFATFIENAFKHGVSYEQESFIDVAVSSGDGRLTFTCRNSRPLHDDSKPGGVGLDNARKRLQLIYGSRFTLDIAATADVYGVTLTLPEQPGA